MSTRELLGTEGGLQKVILILWRKPWALYFTVRTPLVRGSCLRWRLNLGPRYGWWTEFVANGSPVCKGCGTRCTGDTECRYTSGSTGWQRRLHLGTR